MKTIQSINQMIHSTVLMKKGETFLSTGEPCTAIGMVKKGVLRGFIIDTDGNEISTHFFQENDMIIGSFIPNAPAAMNVDVLEDAELTSANYSEVMAWVNKDEELTRVITHQLDQLNHNAQSRLVNLLNLNSVEKYAVFMEEYPSLLNRIPHYHIASYLGITPTQLSRAKKEFLNKCK